MELWTKEHFWQLIPTTIIMLIIALILNCFIGKKSLKVRMIPFQILAVLLFISEIGKQIASATQESGYDLYHIPLHVCSLFIPLLPLMSFYQGKHKDVVRVITCSVTLSMVLFMVVYPNLIYGAGNILNFPKFFDDLTNFDYYFDFHTVFFHNIVIFEFILIIVLRLHHVDENKSYLKPVAIFGAVFAIIAAVMSQLLQTNYANFYTCNVGPVQAFVDSIKEAIGYAAGQTIYVVILGSLHVVFFSGCYYLYRAIDKLNIKLRGKAEQ